MKLAQNLHMCLERPSILFRPRRFVLVLGHMRSCSSLLCHILGSHPDIAGYAEEHQSYRNRFDLLRLRARVYRLLDGQLQGRFVLDKILHNSYSVSDTIVNDPAVYPIFLVRGPLDSLPSILAMGQRIRRVAWYSDPRSVTDYYVERLGELARLANAIDGRCLFLRAEELLDTPAAALQALESFLGLAQPLEESYGIFEHTGQPGWGDDSEMILEGRIVRNPTTARRAELEDGLLRRATRAYDDCCRVLREQAGEARGRLRADLATPRSDRPS